jgi:hypothetical protein
MKPLKSGRSLSQWLLRIALLLIIYILYYHLVTTLKMGSLPFFIVLAAVVFGILVFIGGLISKPWLTIISGFGIFAISIYKIVVSFNGVVDHAIIMQCIPMVIGFHFLSYGNDK